MKKEYISNHQAASLLPPWALPHEDLRNAFFNLSLAHNSRFITAYRFQNAVYEFNRLPFELSFYPFFTQCLTAFLVDFLCPLLQFMWGHIDILIIADQRILLQFVQPLLRIFLGSGVFANWRKSVWHPQTYTSTSFLGTLWDLGVS